MRHLTFIWNTKKEENACRILSSAYLLTWSTRIQIIDGYIPPHMFTYMINEQFDYRVKNMWFSRSDENKINNFALFRVELTEFSLKKIVKINGEWYSSVKKPQSILSTEFVQIHFRCFIITEHREQVQLCCSMFFADGLILNRSCRMKWKTKILQMNYQM